MSTENAATMTEETKPDHRLEQLELINALVHLLVNASKRSSPLSAAWIAMQIVGGVRANEVVQTYCSIKTDSN